METALAGGIFVRYQGAGKFVEGLRSLSERIARLARTQPDRAAELCDTFLAGCTAKAEEIDDSAGHLSGFVAELVRQWIDARQTARSDPSDTIRQLLAWKNDDPYCLFEDAERQAIPSLDQAGRATLKQEASARLLESSDRLRDHWAGVLRAVHVACGQVREYIELCERTKTSPADCLAVAKLLGAEDRLDEALAWLDRGLELEQTSAAWERGSGWEIAEFKRTLLPRLGRNAEVLESAWRAYREAPHVFTYQELMRYVPVEERTAWRAKAMEAADKARLADQMALWVEARELRRLADRVRTATDDELEDVSHLVAEPAAKKLERSHPQLAARVYRALGARIVNAGKSRYYSAALAHFGQAKRCYERAEVNADWDGVVADVRHRHRLKQGFILAFERIAGSGELRSETSFLERARARWRR